MGAVGHPTTWRGVTACMHAWGTQVGVTFKDQTGSHDKATRLTAAFLPDSDDSPQGPREIVVPDVPSGGMLHVVYY